MDDYMMNIYKVSMVSSFEAHAPKLVLLSTEY
jgi:hypothetical protein